MAAMARGVKCGRLPPNPETINTKVRLVRQLMGQGNCGDLYTAAPRRHPVNDRERTISTTTGRPGSG